MKSVVLMVLSTSMIGVVRAAPLDDALAAYDAQDYAAAVALFMPLAEQGDSIAQVNLAFLVFTGKGVKTDERAAAKWYRLAADQGDANAQYNLGVMYENGTGVTKDLQEAVKWWRLSAKQGYAEAQYNLGAFYYNGRGVAKDYVRAYMWKSLAVEQPLTTVALRRARANRDAIAAVMTPAQLEQARAMALACKASGFEDCD